MPEIEKYKIKVAILCYGAYINSAFLSILSEIDSNQIWENVKKNRTISVQKCINKIMKCDNFKDLDKNKFKEYAKHVIRDYDEIRHKFGNINFSNFHKKIHHLHTAIYHISNIIDLNITWEGYIENEIDPEEHEKFYKWVGAYLKADKSSEVFIQYDKRNPPHIPYDQARKR